MVISDFRFTIFDCCKWWSRTPEHSEVEGRTFAPTAGALLRPTLLLFDFTRQQGDDLFAFHYFAIRFECG